MTDLAGCTILLTRSAEDGAAWADVLAARGAHPVVFPCIDCEPIRGEATAAVLNGALERAAWLALTSVRGVEGVAELHSGPLPGDLSIAVVGDKTAAAARAAFGRVDLVASGATAESMARELVERLSKVAAGADTVVAAGSESPRRDLEDILAPQGVEVVRIAVYRTVPAAAEEPRQDLARLGADAIFLASPSAVTGLLARADVADDIHVITIGPSTTAAARQAGLRVDGEATERGLEALIEAMP